MRGPSRKWNGMMPNKSTRTPKVVPQLRRAVPWSQVTSDVKAEDQRAECRLSGNLKVGDAFEPAIVPSATQPAAQGGWWGLRAQAALAAAAECADKPSA